MRFLVLPLALTFVLLGATSGKVLAQQPAAAAPGQPGGMPSARSMSGKARPEQKDPPGQLTVRAISGELSQGEIPVGTLIHLVELEADGSMRVQTKTVKTDNQGRVVFKNLARDNSIAYYVLALMERAGTTDRLMTEAIGVLPKVGSRMLLAGSPVEAAETPPETPTASPAASPEASNPIDDMETLSATGNAIPGPGIVEVVIYAEPSQAEYLTNTSEVQLIEIGSVGDPQHAPARVAGPNSATVQGQSGPMRDLPDSVPGQVSFYTARPSTKADLPGVSIRIERAEAPAGSAAISQVITNNKGLAYVEGLLPGTQYVAIASLYGVELRTQSFTPLADKPLSFAFAYEWKEQDARRAQFDGVAHGKDKIYIAKVFASGRTFYSLPFQLTTARGATVGIFMYPKLLFSMHGGAELVDDKMWFQYRFSLANPGILPLQVSADGMRIPLPKGFGGTSVADEMAARVGVESGKGFLWRGALPPGQRDFIGTFSLPVDGDSMHFDMQMPYGLRGGQVTLEDIPGMELRTPPGAKVVPVSQRSGLEFLQMPSINIEPNQRLVFGITGLPHTSVLEGRLRLGVGIVAMFLVGWALFAMFLGPRGAEHVDPELEKLEADREQLMGKLVKLETEHQGKKGDDTTEQARSYKKRRDSVSAKLAAMYRRIDEHKANSRS